MKTGIMERIVPIEMPEKLPRHLAPFATAAQKIVANRHYDLLARTMHGPRLVALARGRGTLTELKKITGIAVPTLCRIQSGEVLITVEQYVALLKVCVDRRGRRRK
jgi:hypothetical protein